MKNRSWLIAKFELDLKKTFFKCGNIGYIYIDREIIIFPCLIILITLVVITLLNTKFVSYE